MPVKKPNLGRSAPVGSVDLECDAFAIWPCEECLPWHVEIVRDPGDSEHILAREWHAIDCSLFQELLAVFRKPGDGS